MGLFDRISGIGDTITATTGLIAEKKEFAVKQVVNGILLLVILLVFGCLDFMNATFHIEYIFEPSFWATVGSKLVAGICAFNIGINFMWDTEIKKICSWHSTKKNTSGSSNTKWMTLSIMSSRFTTQ